MTSNGSEVITVWIRILAPSHFQTIPLISFSENFARKLLSYMVNFVKDTPINLKFDYFLLFELCYEELSTILCHF